MVDDGSDKRSWLLFPFQFILGALVEGILGMVLIVVMVVLAVVTYMVSGVGLLAVVVPLLFLLALALVPIVMSMRHTGDAAASSEQQGQQTPDPAESTMERPPTSLRR